MHRIDYIEVDHVGANRKKPIRESVGESVLNVLGKNPYLRTPEQKRRLGTAAMVVAGLFLGGIIAASNVESGTDHAECAAEQLDDTPTLPEAEEAVANGCSSGAQEIDKEAATEALLLRQLELADLNG